MNGLAVNDRVEELYTDPLGRILISYDAGPLTIVRAKTRKELQHGRGTVS